MLCAAPANFATSTPQLLMIRPTRRTAVAIAAGMLLASAAQAQTAAEPAPPPSESAAAAAKATATTATPSSPAAQRVEITGGRASDDEQRRRSTAAKIIIGREEIEKFGDATVGEVLRRLPGVTTPGAPGRGGPPRMRGLGSGFTQLLIDGQRVPPGFSLESLTPEQIERIEILRAPTAETGARAIAGTINIITREGFKRRLNDLRMGFSVENGEVNPGLFWTHNDSKEALTYNVSAAVFRPWRRDTTQVDTQVTDTTTGQVLNEHSEASNSVSYRKGLHLSGRLQWRLNEAGDQLMLMPSVFHNEGNSQRESVLTQTVPVAVPGLLATLPEYDSSNTTSRSHSTAARLNMQWRQRLGASRLELLGGVGQFTSVSHSLRQTQGGQGPRTSSDDSDTRDLSANLNVKLSTLLGGKADGSGEHSLVTGLEVEGSRRSDTRTSLLDGQPLLTDFGDELTASTQRVAAYAQDEWALNKNWAVHLGVRWEGINTQGQAENGVKPTNRSSVVTPLGHLLWKPDPARKDQVRLSLTRSYRSPTLASLIARPNLNNSDPVPGSNTPTTADSAGNPALRPELANGLDLAFERYLDGGGVLSANLFHRQISDLMRRVVALETVSWSPVQRYVGRQQNIGDATTQGIELEAKFRLDQAIAEAPGVELRSNLSVYRSRVEGVPGPDNRLDSQAKATANFGADYRFRGIPLTLGGNLNFVPGYRTQLSDEEAVTVSRKRVFDAYALWTFSPSVALRVLASNMAPEDYVTSRQYVSNALSNVATTTSDTHVNWQFRLELKL
jgi:outer membrane receptor for ferrienterochelin and colicins